jgi:PHP family Zn ribbon phosphoesterase
MRQIADFHIHSKYSRACSSQLTLENIEKACRVKGVDIIATGDFTYPEWFLSIKNELEEIPLPTLPFVRGGGFENYPSLRRRGVGEVKSGGESEASGNLYKLKKSLDDKVKFILSTELALIYKDGDRARRIHLVVLAPNIKAVEELNKYLDKKYNIRSDGRPILGMKSPDLVKLCLSIHPKFLIYPAHIWTPWFSVFGSKSGFDSMEECFKDHTENIYAYETGLSSDPEMNWRLSALDKLTLLSNSDAHSLSNIAREANVFELENGTYDEIYNVIKNKIVIPTRHGEESLKGDSASSKGSLATLGMTKKKNLQIPPSPNVCGGEIGIKYTIEFYPEEGMYHFDGHRSCGVSFTPAQSKKNKNICPVCKKPLTIGVMNRVEELADRPEGFVPKNMPGFKKLVCLDKIIAEGMDIKYRSSIKVQAIYNDLIKRLGSELYILMDAPISDIKNISPAVAEGIKRVREGKLIIKPGFDGQYGTVKIFSEEEKEKNKQASLF